MLLVSERWTDDMGCCNLEVWVPAAGTGGGQKQCLKLDLGPPGPILLTLQRPDTCHAVGWIIPRLCVDPIQAVTEFT